jgi:hypothetical protein
MRQLTLDVKEIVDDLLLKFPHDVLNQCRRQREAWKAFFEK